ncbi:MAG: beta-galactosidase [Marinilabiliaceae bacterium]|nr:beta-galactosidase [Marinilabiliaceae bacterium]
MKHLPIFLLFFLMPFLQAQTVTLRFDVADQPTPSPASIAMGTAVSPGGSVFSLNTHHLTRDGRPWYPVMGEMHFSRVPRERWESTLLRMKSGGINTVATYVFWNHHEEVEGVFDWSDFRDLKAFVMLCRQLDIYVWLRIGPWCHGEARNGGFPDWLLRQTKVRGKHPVFMDKVQRFYREIASQVLPSLWKNGGSIIGVQIENEFNFKSQAGLDYMLALKQMAVDAGMDVPYYSVTSWPGTHPAQRDFLLMYGAYPDAPWSKGTDRLKPRPDYLFRKLANDPTIGADQTGASKIEANDRLPYLSAELGGGNQVTWHRRPFIDSLDCVALAYTMAGSGANGLGYYMYAGGVNPMGKLTTLEENKQTRYPNDYALMDYDFQSPIGQSGQTKPSYRHMRLLHAFLNDFGASLATTRPVFADNMPLGVDDGSTPRCALRTDGQSGFLFVSHFQRYGQMQEIPAVQFQVNSGVGGITFPRRPVAIAPNTLAVLPLNMMMGQSRLRYATVQPVCRLDDPDITTWIFTSVDGMTPELAFDRRSVRKLKSAIKPIYDDTLAIVDNIRPGLNAVISWVDAQGKKHRALVLTRAQALDATKVALAERDHLVLSTADVLVRDSKLTFLQQANPVIQAWVFPSLGTDPEVSSDAAFARVRDGAFDRIELRYPSVTGSVAVNPAPELQRPPLSDLPNWLQMKEGIPHPLADTRPMWPRGDIDSCMVLTSFDVADLRQVRAYLCLVPDDEAEVWCNGHRLLRGGKNNVITTIDLTPALVSESNALCLRVFNTHGNAGVQGMLFLVRPGESASFYPIDSTWLCHSLHAAHFSPLDGPRELTLAPAKVDDRSQLPWLSASPGAMYGRHFNPLPGARAWTLVPSIDSSVTYVNDWLLQTRYVADAAALYRNDLLVNDDFWYGRPWLISLGQHFRSETPFVLQLTPLHEGAPFFLDEPYASLSRRHSCDVMDVALIPVYWGEIRLRKK